MKIIEVANRKYIDQDLYDHINKIWINYDTEIANDSNVMFAKNTTINRIITDYTGKNIKRVIKKEKAEYLVLNRFRLNSYPQFYDGNTITGEDSHETVYAIYNFTIEVQDTIELILDFVTRGQNVIYVNQDKLNDSLNNGTIIDKDNYIVYKELIDSNNVDNHKLAANMIINCDLKNSLDWLIYLYFNKYNSLIVNDPKSVVHNYLRSTGLNYVGAGNSNDPFFNVDAALAKIKDKDVKSRFLAMINQKFNDNIQKYLETTCGTKKFKLNDFKIEYDE